MPLYLVRHRGALAVNDNEPVASHATNDHVEPLLETLIEATQHQAERTAGMPNVVSIEVAAPGRFADDQRGAVVVTPDGEWHREAPGGEGESR